MRNWQEKFKDISLKYNMFTIKTNIVMSIIGMVVQYAGIWILSVPALDKRLFLMEL